MITRACSLDVSLCTWNWNVVRCHVVYELLVLLTIVGGGMSCFSRIW